ncbi:MAG: beta-ketoacyl-[acyl-carrier-protein] synthase family protein [Nitrospirae bacterium]|nr:beta-ketoacyl-[acyl-carrier-protein] synthase family protein [Nitrospirota bacterium]
MNQGGYLIEMRQPKKESGKPFVVIWFTMHRIALTGIGAVTPLGSTFNASWEAACRQRSGIAPVTRFKTDGIPWKVCGEVKGFDPVPYLSVKEIRRLDPFAQYAVKAALMAAEDAGLVTQAGEGEGATPQQINYLNSGGVIIGSSRGGIRTIEMALSAQLPDTGRRTRNRRFSPYLMPSTTISMAASYTAQKLGLKGYCLGISNACSSGTNAIGEAYRMIKAGFTGPVIAGGADAPLCRTCLEGYGSAGALSKIPDQSASRPFDRHRDGFVLSEGACIVVLEEYEAAQRRGARIYAEIIGYGNSVDAFHQTQPLAEGEARAMNSALTAGGITPSDVDLISSHGTSTPVGDIAECEAIHLVFGEQAARIPVTAIKSMSGHMLAASGAFETACTAMAISQSTLLPTINLSEQDEKILLSVVREAQSAEIGTAMVNSFGFGGVNAVLVLKKIN